MKTKQKKSKRNFTPLIITLSAIALVIAGLLIVGRGYFTSKYSEAESKNYNKTYPAGDIVNYKPTPFKYYRGKLVSVKSQGGNIRMPSKPGGPMTDGWTISNRDMQWNKSNEGWVYLSKWFAIPKTKKPVAVYVCWRALSRNTTVKLQLNKGINDVWATKKGEYLINFYHGYETDPQRYREIACWGYYDVAYRQVVPRSYPQNQTIKKGQYLKKPSGKIQARIYIKVPEGGVEIASIKVFEPTKPPEHDSNGYYLRQFETDITR